MLWVVGLGFDGRWLLVVWVSVLGAVLVVWMWVLDSKVLVC